MEFKHIEAFVKVIELGSFSKAANEIFLSQPSISTYINKLEQGLGEVLLNRSTKEISLTLAGKIFYESGKEILALKHNAVERIKSLPGNFSGEINVLASSVPAQYILPEILARFKGLYPDISFNVKQADTLETARGIITGTAEIGFTGGVLEQDKCKYEEIMTEKMIFIAPNGKGFSDTKKYTLEELLYTHTFISREKGSGSRNHYENFFTEQNIDLNKVNIGFTFDNTQSIITSVMNGLGISIVSEVAATAFIAEKMIIPIKLTVDLPTRKFYYILKKNFFHSHLIDLFTNFLENPSES